MPLTPDYVAPGETPADRVRAALDLCELGERMLRERLRRDNPNISDEQIETAVDAWYARRPGAEHGDMPGVPSSRFR
jgi:hypothetical protein